MRTGKSEAGNQNGSTAGHIARPLPSLAHSLPNRFPSNSHLFPNVPKHFPNNSQLVSKSFPILCLIGFALDARRFPEEYRDGRAKVFAAQEFVAPRSGAFAFSPPTYCQSQRKTNSLKTDS